MQGFGHADVLVVLQVPGNAADALPCERLPFVYSTEKGYIGPMVEKVKKSRTQRKREVKALQKLGEALVLLTPEQLQQVPMEEELLEAVLFAKRLKKHEARRRQLQYIGSLMRHVDPEPIQKALSRIDQDHQIDINVFRQTEKWRDQLLSGDKELFSTLTERFKDFDDQKVFRMIERSHSEKAAGRPLKASKALFRLLKPFAHRWIYDR